MIDVNNLKLYDILPSSLHDDETISNIIKSLDGIFPEFESQIRKIRFYEYLDEQPAEVLDLLAWQFHVDFYDYDYSNEVKRELIRQSITWHRRKGTPMAVEEMVSPIFPSAEIVEWWDYGGTPYRFRVSGITDPLTGAADIRRLLTLINSAKNKRSWLDYVQFKRSTATENHIAMLKSTVKTIDVYPAAVEKIAPESTFYTAMAMTTTERLTLYIGGI